MYRVYDLCLGCKGCKRECPSGLDVAKMKIEFLAHYNSARGIPVRAKMFGYIHELSRIASQARFLANFATGSQIPCWVLAQLGIYPNRSLPRFAPETFTDWFYKHQSVNHKTPNGKVVYFHDTWVTFYYPEVGKAAVKLLESAGFDAILAPQRVCCGPPMLSKGMVEPARSRARRNAALLAPYASQGIAIIGTEPSCILTFPDEYQGLLPGNADAKIVAENTFLLEEFLLKLQKDGKLNIS